MSGQRQPKSTTRTLIKYMQLEIATTSATISDISRLLALNYFTAEPDPEGRAVTMHDWRGLDESRADHAKASNLKRLQRYLDGTTSIPADLIWPWINCLEVHRDDCLAEFSALGGGIFVDTTQGRHNTTLSATLRHTAEIIEHDAEILRDGVIDHNDAPAVEEFSLAADKLIASLQGFKRHLRQRSGLDPAIAVVSSTPAR